MIALLFFASGAVALAFEGLWFEQAGLAFGSSVWASSLVLGGFMAGMALGNWWAATYGGRVRNPLRAYALLELAVAASGVALVYGLPLLGSSLAPFAGALLDTAPWLLRTVHFLIGFALLLLPSCAMGMTLPLLTRVSVGTEAGFGRTLGVLYGANTLGATCGVLAAETLLVGRFGIRGSALVAGGVGVVVAAAALLLARGADERPRMPAGVGAAAGKPHVPRAEVPWLIAAALAGFALLALEVVWLRFLLLFLNDTRLAFAVVLAIVLAGIGVGSLLGSLLARTAIAPSSAATCVAYAAGLLGLAGYLLYPTFLQGRLAADQGVGTVLRIAAPLVLPTSLASGALFPLLGAGLRDVVGADAAAAGRLGFANTVGAALGLLLAGFVLLPWLGMERSLVCLFALYGVVAWALPVQREPPWLFRGAPLLAFCIALLGFPFGSVRTQYVQASSAKWLTPGAVIADVREGRTSTIVHVVHRHHGVPLIDQLVTNSYSMTSNGFLGRRYMDLFVVLPVALHPRVERALVVGYGMGNTAEALARTPELERIDIVDISTEMLSQSRRLASHPGPSPLDDPRARVHIDDGRFYLQVTRERYDLITGEPPPPIMAGVARLYTGEYFRLVHARLREGGIASYWLPLMNLSAPSAKSIIRGFCSAFADCSLWHGSSRNFMLLGTRGQPGAVGEERFTAQWREPRVKDALMRAGFEFPAQLPALFIGDAPYLAELTADAPPLTDDWPQRMHQPGSRAERDALIEAWRDTRAARERFMQSALIARLVPETLRTESLPMFETQTLLDQLSYPEGISLRNTRLLHEVMRKTRLRAPVLLLLDSDPGYEAALARLSPAERERPEWLPHRAASLLADRDLAGALAVLRRVPDAQLAMADLTAYVEYALKRAAGSTPTPSPSP